MCKNSFGACMFEPGPAAPVTRNCALGNMSNSMPMKGMLPPSPMCAHGLSKYVREAVWTASFSHSSSRGACHPFPVATGSSVIRAPCGGSLVRIRSRRCMACGASRVGGSLMDSLSFVKGSITFPATRVGGRPSQPMTLSAGRHVRARMCSETGASFATGCPPSTKENCRTTVSPRISAAADTCLTRLSGTSTWNSSGTTNPVFSSSRRESSSRQIRKEEGTMPELVPLWAPSISICAVRFTATQPRSDVVIHSCS
mmetsp:Transcript_72421/g.120716  ORF Transcript_72421/g.120716 Transcript_72421/m.120716 type:complete len:256 (+) Transcript_72421:489-1256(+)